MSVHREGENLSSMDGVSDSDLFLKKFILEKQIQILILDCDNVLIRHPLSSSRPPYQRCLKQIFVITTVLISIGKDKE